MQIAVTLRDIKKEEAQTSSARKEHLERRIRLLHQSMERHDSDKNTRHGFEEHIAELEAELLKLKEETGGRNELD